VWLFLLWRASERRELLIVGAIAFGGALLLYLPWLPTVLYQVAHTGAPWSEPPTIVSLLSTPVRMLGDFAVVALLLVGAAGLVPLWRRDSPAVWLLAIALITVVLAWLSSQLSPAWAQRYLAVAVGPLLLAVVAGLANAGRLGVAALIVGAALGAADGAPDDKSNVRDVARTISPSLRAGDLVVVTQPEQVSVLAYYLPEGVRFATLTGAVQDTGVTDWRDGTDRLGAATPEKDLEPLLDELEPGQRVALVTPIFADIRRWQAPWTEQVRLKSGEWRQFISNDSRFAVSAVEPELPIERRPNAQQATVLVKRAE
jgi:hypothetical protein